MSSSEPTSILMFEEALKTWNSLLDFEDSLASEHDESNARPQRVDGPTFTPLAVMFATNSPKVDTPDIPNDDFSCPICMQPYHTITEHEADSALSVAQKLPCGHLLCNECLQHWFSPYERNNTCPVCRQQIYPARPSAEDESLEALQDCLDHLSWTNRCDPERRTPESVMEERKSRRWMLLQQAELCQDELFDELDDERVRRRLPQPIPSDQPATSLDPRLRRQEQCERHLRLHVIDDILKAIAFGNACDYDDGDLVWWTRYLNHRRDSLLWTEEYIDIVLRAREEIMSPEWVHAGDRVILMQTVIDGGVLTLGSLRSRCAIQWAAETTDTVKRHKEVKDFLLDAAHQDRCMGVGRHALDSSAPLQINPGRKS